jgi:hypothetical protein
VSFLRNIISDLVEKKLWPVAIALIAAIIAVPMVLSGGGDTESPVPSAVATATPATTATTAGRIVSLDSSAQTGEVERSGDTLNPFIQHHVPKAGAATSTTAAPATGGAGGLPGTGTTDTTGTSTTPATGTTPTTSTGGSGTTTPTTTEADSTVYRVNVKFGKEGEEKSIDDIARLTPLPSSTEPLFVFMGVKDDLKTAVFLISSDAVPADGDGVCKPTKDECSTLELQVGDSEVLSAAAGTAGETQYLLTLEGIHKGKAKDKATAASLHARESLAGREVIRAAVATDPEILSGWSFSKALGVLQETAGAATDDTASVGHVPSELLAKAAGETTVNVLTPTLTLPAATTPAP